MILKQYYLGCLAHASYLVADEESKVAAIVDPQRDVDQYIADAEAQGPRRSATCSSPTSTPTSSPGHLELRDRVRRRDRHGGEGGGGVRPPDARHRRLARARPEVRLEVLETPGHSPESISILVYDAEHGEQPYAVLTGDTLFIGDVGRPDLRAALGWTAEDLGSPALRVDPGEAAPAARRDARLPGPRRGLAVRQEPQHRHGLDDRRAAAVQLRAAADDEGASSSGSSRPTSRTRPRTSRTTRSSTRRSARRSRDARARAEARSRSTR